MLKDLGDNVEKKKMAAIGSMNHSKSISKEREAEQAKLQVWYPQNWTEVDEPKYKLSRYYRTIPSHFCDGNLPNGATRSLQELYD